MADRSPADVNDLLQFLDASPSPFHAVATVAQRLETAGFRRVDESMEFPAAGRHFVVRGGSLVAWAHEHSDQIDYGFRIVGAHTDSPNLRIKPRPDTGNAGYRQLGVEVYGGALWNSWMDRDLGLSGRVCVQGEREPRLLKVNEAVLRVPQLAIHLDRAVNEGGLQLNPQQHLVPVWGLGRPTDGTFADFIAQELGVAPSEVVSWDVMLHDVTPASLLGHDGEFVSSARIDNLLSCWAASCALVESLGADGASAGAVPVICLFDHEEVGSETATGAAGSLLPTVLERISLGGGGGREQLLRALANSKCVSADGAHATHPNYVERHEPNHRIDPNAGPVIKINSNMRYATDATCAAWFIEVCERAGVPTQQFVTRTDMACGSTIGPTTSARLGISTVDVGVAQLSMHSARELCGSADPTMFVRALASFLEAHS